MPQEGCARSSPFLKRSHQGEGRTLLLPQLLLTHCITFISAAVVLYAMPHIVVVQYSLHEQWEEEAPGKGWAGQTDSRQRYGFPKVSCAFYDMENYFLLKNNNKKSFCNVNTEFTLVSHLVLNRLILNKI